jgi:RNA polymerase sigma-70 factor (ECF subfamily)
VNPSNSTDFQSVLSDCIGQLRQNPRVALAELFDLTAQRLVRFALGVTGNQADAEDALQAAFSGIARRPGLLGAADAPWPYLIRSVRNECLKILQKRKRHCSTDQDVAASPSAVAEQMVREETADGVRRILRTLPQDQYEVVILKHWEELTFAEIADALGLSQNTVASRYRYAMEKLQRSLEQLGR